MAKSLPTPFNPPPPTTLLMWRHGFARAKRRKFKFSIFKVRISATQICKFNTKFDRNKDKAKYREMIFRVLKQN